MSYIYTGIHISMYVIHLYWHTYMYVCHTSLLVYTYVCMSYIYTGIHICIYVIHLYFALYLRVYIYAAIHIWYTGIHICIPGMRTRYRPGAGTKDFKISPVPVLVDFSIQYQIKNFYTWLLLKRNDMKWLNTFWNRCSWPLSTPLPPPSCSYYWL